MRLARSLWLVALGAAAIAALCFLLQTWMTVRSSDLALHYTLVDYFTRSWSLPPQVVNPTMAGYSPISHMVGGGVGRLVGSGFLGMHFASLAFVFLIYVFLFLGLERPALLPTIASYAALFLVIALLRNTFAQHGYELVYTYFYAQVAGEAAFLAVLWILSGRERDRSELLLLPLLVFAMGWVFPLSQVKLAIGILVLWFLDIIRVWISTRMFDWRRLGLVLVMGGFFAAAILLHPVFDHFHSMSSNNGATRQTFSLVTIGGVAGLLCAASLVLAGLALTQKLGLTRPLFIATAGLATVAAFFAQAVLYFGFGEASEYAVRKHTYALTTLLAVAVIALVAEVAQRTLPFVGRARLPTVLGGGAMAIASAFLVTLLLISHYAEGRTEFLAYQREVRAQPLLRRQTISLNRDHPGEFNLAISMVDLDLPGELYPLVPIILTWRELKEPIRALPRFALISRQARVPPACARSDLALLHAKVVDYGCTQPVD